MVVVHPSMTLRLLPVDVAPQPPSLAAPPPPFVPLAPTAGGLLAAAPAVTAPPFPGLSSTSGNSRTAAAALPLGGGGGGGGAIKRRRADSADSGVAAAEAGDGWPSAHPNAAAAAAAAAAEGADTPRAWHVLGTGSHIMSAAELNGGAGSIKAGSNSGSSSSSSSSSLACSRPQMYCGGRDFSSSNGVALSGDASWRAQQEAQEQEQLLRQTSAGSPPMALQGIRARHADSSCDDDDGGGGSGSGRGDFSGDGDRMGAGASSSRGERTPALIADAINEFGSFTPNVFMQRQQLHAYPQRSSINVSSSSSSVPVVHALVAR